MSFSSKMALKYIKTQKKHNIFIILSIASALMLTTFIFTLFSSFYSTMLYNERQKLGYHGMVHHITLSDYEKLTKSEMITQGKLDLYGPADTTGVAYVNFRNDIYDPETFIREFAEENFENKEYSLSLHEELLEYEIIGIHAKASLAKKLVLIIAIVFFILFCARFVIDTAFEISSRDKEVQFGILASLGASKNQIAAIIMWQGAFLSVIGIPLGLALGTAVGGFVFSFADSTSVISYFTQSDRYSEGIFSVSVPYLIVAAIIGFLWVILSAYGTGRRYSAKSPIESIMQSNKKIIKPKKSRPTKKASGKVSGLALKNIRRDKKSFFVTSLALIISYTMISFFSVFLDYWNATMTDVKKQGLISENIADDYSLYYVSEDTAPENNAEEAEECYRILENCPEDIYFSSAQQCTLPVTRDSYMLRDMIPFDKGYLDITDNDDIYNKGDIRMIFYFLNRQFYDEIFAEDSGVSYDELVNGKGFIVCETSAPMQRIHNDEVISFEGCPLETGGESLKLNLYDIHGRITSTDTEVNLLGSTPAKGRFATNAYSLILVGAEDHLKAINKGSIIDSAGFAEFMIGLPRDNNKTLLQMYDGLKNYLKDYPQFELADNNYNGSIESMMDTESRMVPVLSVIAVVVAVVTLISIIHLINIISTGIMNRRKEIASLTSIGMTRWQLFRMLLTESVGYTITAGLVALALTLGVAFLMNSYAISKNFDLLFSYGYAVAAPLLSALGGFIISSVTILVSLKIFDRVSVAEEMKTIE
ncbi:MAG: ABC transporter permease [Ruminiclostridium sp.]|nr:ABC transporter permease [Ruminiclostridium sp.]